MLKKLGLKLSISKNNKFVKTREILSLRETKNVGVLISDLNETRQALDFLTKEFKKIDVNLSVIALNNQKEKITGHVVDFEIGDKDFSWIGQEKSATLKKIVKTPFDYLFCLNTSPNLPFENILSQSVAKCRVGVDSENTNSNLFDLVISPKSTKDWLSISKEILHNIKMLKN